MNTRRRAEDYSLWDSTSSDDPLDPEAYDVVKADPTPEDIIYLRRYIARCTPEELRLVEARTRNIERAF